MWQLVAAQLDEWEAMMAIDRKQLDDLICSLKKQRDELAVQIHLGKAEAKQQWDKVTAQLDQLNRDYQPAKEAAEESAENILAALKLVAGEVQEGFDRVRKSL
jgi:biopolymer transport protein ExbB/TolQ